jgi:hypothetical protein
MVARFTAVSSPRPEPRPNQSKHGASRARDSAVPNASRECQRAMPQRPRRPTPCVQQRLATLLVLLTLAASALAAILHVSTARGSVANVGSSGGAPSDTLAEPLAMARMPQFEPEAIPTARIRYDIPGWDSIRRTATSTEVSAVEPLSPPTPEAVPPKNFLVPAVLALLPCVLGWVGLSLMLRYAPDAPAAPTDGTPGSLLSGLREMASKKGVRWL